MKLLEKFKTVINLIYTSDPTSSGYETNLLILIFETLKELVFDQMRGAVAKTRGIHGNDLDLNLFHFSGRLGPNGSVLWLGESKTSAKVVKNHLDLISTQKTQVPFMIQLFETHVLLSDFSLEDHKKID